MTRPRVLLCLSHSIEEYDQLRLLHGLGYQVASIGGYIDPAHPHDPKRPPLPEVPAVPEIRAAVDAMGAVDNLEAAQRFLPEAVLDWADVIVYHHYLDRLFGQWDRIERWRAQDSARRVVWRTVGQSGPSNELAARPFVRRGLEVVRYSPLEENIPGYAGQAALIRFYKDPAEWCGWTGDGLLEAEAEAFGLPAVGPSFVANVTQGLATRDPWTNFGFWENATLGLSRMAVGPGNEGIPDGVGEVPLDTMRLVLRRARAYLYTGTQPASYTLGLLEALMTGVPVVSIGPAQMRLFDWGPGVFEGHRLAEAWADDPAAARDRVRALLEADPEDLDHWSGEQRARTVATFGKVAVGAAWARYLR